MSSPPSLYSVVWGFKSENCEEGKHGRPGYLALQSKLGHWTRSRREDLDDKEFLLLKTTSINRFPSLCFRWLGRSTNYKFLGIMNVVVIFLLITFWGSITWSWFVRIRVTWQCCLETLFSIIMRVKYLVLLLWWGSPSEWTKPPGRTVTGRLGRCLVRFSVTAVLRRPHPWS